MSLWVAGIIILIVKLLLVLVALLLFAAYLIYVERRLLGFFQLRLGPNRAGPWGLLQPIADAVKLLTKEDLSPRRGGPGHLPLRPGGGGRRRHPHLCRGPLCPGMDL